MWFGKNMAKYSKTRHFIPVIIIPSKVFKFVGVPDMILQYKCLVGFNFKKDHMSVGDVIYSL